MNEAPPMIIGINTRYYPAQVGTVRPHPDDIGDHSANPPPTRAVLVEGEIGDYACYVGHGDALWVARHGNKISFEEAKAQFPTIEKEKYRL